MPNPRTVAERCPQCGAWKLQYSQVRDDDDDKMYSVWECDNCNYYERIRTFK